MDNFWRLHADEEIHQGTSSVNVLSLHLSLTYVAMCITSCWLSSEIDKTWRSFQTSLSLYEYAVWDASDLQVADCRIKVVRRGCLILNFLALAADSIFSCYGCPCNCVIFWWWCYVSVDVG